MPAYNIDEGPGCFEHLPGLCSPAPDQALGVKIPNSILLRAGKMIK